MATVTDWMKAAEEEAKKHSDAIKANNQYLVDQLNQSKQNTLDQLKQQQDNSIYNLNTNKATINQNAMDNAKQLNVAKLIALKDSQQSMNRAGLGTQGVVGSQVNAINNDYATNLTNVLNQKTNDLRNLEKEKNDTLLAYNTNRLNLENEYGNNLANLQQSINDKALNQYNNVYNNYLAYKQQEYENEQAELARQEAIRQYNEQMAYQKEQDAKQLAYQYYVAKLNNSGGTSGFDDGAGGTTNNTDSETYNSLYNGINKMISNGFYNSTEAKRYENEVGAMITQAYESGKLSDADAERLFKMTEKFGNYINKQTDKTSSKSSTPYIKSTTSTTTNNNLSTPYNNQTKLPTVFNTYASNLNTISR